MLAYERIVRDTPGGALGARTERLLSKTARNRRRVQTGARRAEGDPRASTLLATGGFGGDPELRAATSIRRRATCRCAPKAQQGRRVAPRRGRRRGLRPGAGFYGQWSPSGELRNPYEFTDLTFYHCEHGVLLNLAGRRFCDETIGDHVSPLA